MSIDTQTHRYGTTKAFRTGCDKTDKLMHCTSNTTKQLCITGCCCYQIFVLLHLKLLITTTTLNPLHCLKTAAQTSNFSEHSYIFWLLILISHDICTATTWQVVKEFWQNAVQHVTRCCAIIEEYIIPFTAYTAEETPNTFQWPDNHQKLPLQMGISGPIQYMVPSAPASQPPNHISMGSAVIAGLMNVTNRQTDTRDRPHYSVCSNRPHLTKNNRQWHLDTCYPSRLSAISCIIIKAFSLCINLNTTTLYLKMTNTALLTGIRLCE